MSRFRNTVQIAGVRDLGELRLLESCGVDMAGFPLRLPVNKEDLTEEAARELMRIARIPTVLITYLNKSDELDAFVRKMRPDMLQIHGSIRTDELRRFALDHPMLPIIKSLVVKENNLRYLKGVINSTWPWVTAFILDSFDSRTGAKGATGKTHDWSVSRELVNASPHPVILAGGLNADNVAEAIEQVRPDSVDAHTGVEDASGAKDPEKVSRFVKAAKTAFHRCAVAT